MLRVKVKPNYYKKMKNLMVKMSEDDPREGSLNEWYNYIHSYTNKRLNVTRNENDSKELIES